MALLRAPAPYLGKMAGEINMKRPVETEARAEVLYFPAPWSQGMEGVER